MTICAGEYKKTAAIVLAAGIGSRMGSKNTKQTLKIAGKSVLNHVLKAFFDAKSVSEVIVVCREEEIDFVNNELQNAPKPCVIVTGGKCRSESASRGFEKISENVEYIMVHDAARCLVTPSEIDSVAIACYEHQAATASISVNDTIKLCDGDKIVETLPRNKLRAMQTPQAFSRDIYARALCNIEKLDESITDDNMLVEMIGIKPFCVETLPSNIKITTSYDLELAEFILLKRNGDL